jgi:hypothetical protein
MTSGPVPPPLHTETARLRGDLTLVTSPDEVVTDLQVLTTLRPISWPTGFVA